MHIEQVRDFALSLPGTEEYCPFGPETLVFKANDRMFLLLPLDEGDLRFNVKCDPERAIQQRMEYPDAILPGYHMNKKHWNTVIADGRIPDDTLLQLIRDSYDLVQKRKK